MLVPLYRSPEDNRRRGRPHRIAAQLLHRLLRLLLRWFPDRQFVCAGDQNYGGHEMAALAPRTGGRLHGVSKFYPDAALHEPPPASDGHGRPRVQGAKLPTPQEVVAQAERTRLNVAWYGGGRRDVEVVSGIGHWYQAGQGLVPVRWMCVHDLTGSHRDEYFDSTDLDMTPRRSSRNTPAAGTSRPPLPTPGPTWAWRVPAVGANGRSDVPSRACWDCTAWSH